MQHGHKQVVATMGLYLVWKSGRQHECEEMPCWGSPGSPRVRAPRARTQSYSQRKDTEHEQHKQQREKGTWDAAQGDQVGASRILPGERHWMHATAPTECKDACEMLSPREALKRPSTQVLYWGLVPQAPLQGTYKESTLLEGKQMLSINHAVQTGEGQQAALGS